MTMRKTVGKVLYGVLFTIILPLLLLLWAVKTSHVVRPPPVHSLSWGLGILALGMVLMSAGMTSLWRLGGGLPMNAFPPPRYVAGGVYGLFSHPIYLGFCLACVGVAVATGSASGLWLV